MKKPKYKPSIKPSYWENFNAYLKCHHCGYEIVPEEFKRHPKYVKECPRCRSKMDTNWDN